MRFRIYTIKPYSRGYDMNKRKRVAVFGNGWSDEYLKTALEGIHRCAKEHGTDLYMFIEYSAMGQTNEEAQGDINIINLVDFNDYDGVILLGNTLNNFGELSIIHDRVLKSKIPAVCLEYELDGIDCICTDNYSGMRELCEHLVNEHGIRDVVYVSGDVQNLENKERLRAVKEVLQTKGVTIDEKHIINGEWSYYAVQEYVPTWVKENGLPEAFICANDVMAMGTIFSLINLGYEVPTDVIVTGFDNIMSAQTFAPVVTSGDRGWDERSYQGMEHLLKLIDGEKPSGIMRMPSRVAVGESCGCPISAKSKKMRNNYVNNSYVVPITRTMFDWHLSGLDTVTNSVKKLDDMHDGFANLFKQNPEISFDKYEGATFCMCLDSTFVKSISEPVSPLRIGYSDTMDVIFARNNSQVMPRHTIKTSYIFPIFEEDKDETSTYLISPLHHDGAVLGYAVFKNQYKMIDQYFLQSWLNHISIGLFHAEQSIRMETMNQRLNEMSIMDELSGLFNRKGYERRAIPFIENIRAEGKDGILMVVDINKMKNINDLYGHLQGDLAIRIVSKAIAATIPEDWYGIRYGGDEFVILGEKRFIDDGNAIKNQLCEAVKKQAEDMMLPFDLTISVGSVSINAKDKIAFNEYFKMADNAMYEMKKILHEGQQ